jgi:hypothetical protein
LIFILPTVRAADLGTRPVNATTKLPMLMLIDLNFVINGSACFFHVGKDVYNQSGERRPQEANHQLWCGGLTENGKCFDVIHTNLDINTLAIQCETKDDRLCRALSFPDWFIALSHPLDAKEKTQYLAYKADIFSRPTFRNVHRYAR